MTNSVVSVIITCFNQEKQIIKTLQSVLNQTHIVWECIIINDGSTDNSEGAIKAFVKDDLRFKYKYQANKGVSAARNAGFKLATGNFVNFLDGDDTLFPRKIEKQLNVFQMSPDVEICICDHQHYNSTKDIYKYFIYETLKPNPLEQILYKWHKGVAFPIHAPLYKRSIWTDDELPYPQNYTGRSEDWVFNILVALKHKSYYFIDEVLCTYHHYDTNYTSRVLNSASSAIEAAIFIKPLLPEKFQPNFINFTIEKSMNRYLHSEKAAILRNSGNWRLGNFLTNPLFWLKKKLKFKN